MASEYEKRVLRVLDHIFANPAGDLSLDALADVAAMSRFHWHRVFHGMTGETCAAAVRRIRLHRAACWLVQGDMRVDEIALKVGYPSSQSFGRAFRSAYGMSPIQFRKSGANPALLNLRNERNDQMYDVTIETCPARNVAVLAHTGPYIEIGGAFEKLGTIIAARNLWAQVSLMLGVYLDDPACVPAAELRSYAGIELKEGAKTPEGLEPYFIPAGRVARLRYVGPYVGLPAVYDYFYGQWLPSAGVEPADQPCYEVYLNSPSVTDPADLITDLYLPLKG